MATPAVLEGQLLQKVKAELRRVLLVDASIAARGCIRCDPNGILTSAAARWYSSAGQREYPMSGCCEFCYDLIDSELTVTNWSEEIMTDSDRIPLTAYGHVFLSFWIPARKAQKRLVISTDMERQLLKWVCAVNPWPRIHSRRARACRFAPDSSSCVKQPKHARH